MAWASECRASPVDETSACHLTVRDMSLSLCFVATLVTHGICGRWWSGYARRASPEQIWCTLSGPSCWDQTFASGWSHSTGEGGGVLCGLWVGGLVWFWAIWLLPPQGGGVVWVGGWVGGWSGPQELDTMRQGQSQFC